MKLCFTLATAIFILVLAQQANLWAQEQQRFGLEGPFDHPVPLSDSAREALLSYVGPNSNSPKSEHGFLEHRAQEEGTSTKNIPASWFVASSVTLKRGGPPSLVVVCSLRASGVLTPDRSGFCILLILDTALSLSVEETAST